MTPYQGAAKPQRNRSSESLRAVTMSATVRYMKQRPATASTKPDFTLPKREPHAVDRAGPRPAGTVQAISLGSWMRIHAALQRSAAAEKDCTPSMTTGHSPEKERVA